MLVTHTQLAFNTIYNVDPIQVIFWVNSQNVTDFWSNFWQKMCKEVFNVVFITHIWQWLFFSMHVSDDKYVPQRKYVTDLDQGPNIASYSTSSLVPILPWKA